MSMDIEAVCESASPPEIVTVARMLDGAVGLNFCVVRDWQDWGNYQIQYSGPVADEDVFVLWLSDSSVAATIIKAMERRNVQSIETVLRQNQAGAVQCFADWPRIHIVPFQGNGTLNFYAADALAQAFVTQRGGHYELDGERFQITGNIIQPSVSIVAVKESTQDGSDEEAARRFQAEHLAWNECTDGDLTDECCPKCRKPMPSYRKSCRFCGFSRGRL